MIARIARRPQLNIEILEPRRLLSFDGSGVADDVAPDWEQRAVNPSEADLMASSAGADHLVVAPTRTPIYPPLAPAMWMDESVGSFELPEAVTIAFFVPDPPSEAFLDNEGELVDVATDASQQGAAPVARPVEQSAPPISPPATSSITDLIFEPDRRLAELEGIALT